MSDDYEIKPFCIILSKTSAYVKSYDGETKWVYFLIEDDELLEKYNDILNKVNNSIRKEFDIERIYNKIDEVDFLHSATHESFL